MFLPYYLSDSLVLFYFGQVEFQFPCHCFTWILLLVSVNLDQMIFHGSGQLENLVANVARSACLAVAKLAVVGEVVLAAKAAPAIGTRVCIQMNTFLMI